MRTVIAFFVAPLAVVIAIAAADPGAWGLGAALTIFYAYPAMLLIGLPLYFYFQRRGWLTYRHVTTSGAIVGALISALFLSFLLFGPASLSGPGTKGVTDSLLIIGGVSILGAGLGALSGLVFCLVAFGRDRHGPAARMPSNPSLERP